MPAGFDWHPSEEDLERYSIGKLAEEQLASLEEHLLVCETCQERLSEVDAYVKAAQRAARKLKNAPPTFWQHQWAKLSLALWIPAPVWVAALAVAATVLVWTIPRWVFPGAVAPAAVMLRSIRGPAGLSTNGAPAGKPLRLHWDETGLPAFSSYRVEIVNSSGRPVFETTVEAGKTGSSLLVGNPLRRGRYWVRLYAPPPRAELLREFGLEVE